MSDVQFPESMVGGITDGGSVGMSIEAHNSAIGLTGQKSGKKLLPSGKALETADSYLQEALARLENNLSFAEGDLENLQNRIDLRNEEIRHYKYEIAKLKAILQPQE